MRGFSFVVFLFFLVGCAPPGAPKYYTYRGENCAKVCKEQYVYGSDSSYDTLENCYKECFYDERERLLYLQYER
jgi:hypothetical protein